MYPDGVSASLSAVTAVNEGLNLINYRPTFTAHKYATLFDLMSPLSIKAPLLFRIFFHLNSFQADVTSLEIHGFPEFCKKFPRCRRSLFLGVEIIYCPSNHRYIEILWICYPFRYRMMFTANSEHSAFFTSRNFVQNSPETSF
jgi:hypothetical protein